MLSAFGSLPRVFAASEAALLSAVPDLAVVRQLAVTRAVMEEILRPLAGAVARLPSGQTLVRYLWTRMAHSDVEQVRVLFLDGRGAILRDEEVARGCTRQAVLDPRMIVRRSLELGAQRLVVAHNHPSGDPTPSATDRKATELLVAAARLFGIQVQDHLVLASGGWSSMRALGWLEL